jgi:uncharacterized protein YjbI with pentapeptide repeats
VTVGPGRKWRLIVALFILIITGVALGYLASRVSVVPLILIGVLELGGFALFFIAAERNDWRGDLGRALVTSALFGLVLSFYSAEVASRDREQAFKAQLSTQRDFRGSDLSGADLTDVDLAGKDFSGADLTGAHLEDDNLTGADLSGADLDGAHLDGAVLGDAQLDEASLTGAHLAHAALPRANLRHARLPDAGLQGAGLTAANLTGACLVGADLTGARLVGARLNGAVLTSATVTDAVFASDLRRAAVSPVARPGHLYRQGASLKRTTGTPASSWPPASSKLKQGAPPMPRPNPPPHLVPEKVKRVSDGDSLVVEGIGPAQLAGINAPPLDDGGTEAAEFLRERTSGRVEIQFALKRRDDFGRRLVYVWRGNHLINATLAERGYVNTTDITASTPHQRILLQAEERAKEDGRGVWQECPPD